MIRPSCKFHPALTTLALGGSSLFLATAPAIAEIPASAPKDRSVSSASAPARPLTASRGAFISISPLRVELDGPAAAQTVRLSNSGSIPVVVQTRIFAWKQDSSGDQYAQSNVVIASPAIATIQPGQTQIVRLMRTGAVGNREQTFRISIDQLPDANAPESTAAATRLRFLLPLFVDRAAAQPARLDWSLTQGGLRLVNNGGRTARIASIKILDASGKELPLENNSLRYVQAGNAAIWPLPGGCASGATRLVADVDEAAIDALLSKCG
ncbi:MAG: molecular chaperone [Proteobacteria bacterium]|nr:molecular chaperone [Pseudomonadota bacterium]